MLMFSLLVIQVGFKSVIFFLGFALLFYLLSYKYTIYVIKFIYNKIKTLIDKKKKQDNWKQLNNENISYDKLLKMIKLNSKTYNFDQIVSIDLIANSKKMEIKELKKLDNIKKLEIKIGTKIKKVTYRHFKYITSPISSKKLKKIKRKTIADYKALKKF